jgi:GDPmannose 4,6-dehydratase
MQWMMLQQDQPKDYVIATGVQYSVRQFIEKSAAQLGITLRFEGQGISEYAVVVAISGDKAPSLKLGDVVVRVDPNYFRPAEVETLLGDPSLAKKDLGWIPQITLDEMLQEMMASDLEQSRQHALLKLHGYSVQVSKEK